MSGTSKLHVQAAAHVERPDHGRVARVRAQRAGVDDDVLHRHSHPRHASAPQPVDGERGRLRADGDEPVVCGRNRVSRMSVVEDEGAVAVDVSEDRPGAAAGAVLGEATAICPHKGSITGLATCMGI